MHLTLNVQRIRNEIGVFSTKQALRGYLVQIILLGYVL